MSNNKQSVELTGITAPLLPATQGLTMEDQVSIDFLLECSKRGRNRGNQRKPSICKVSRILRDQNERSFEPQLVSIGPIHREDPKLQEFEWLKECYLDDLLYRSHDSTPKKTLLEACLLKVNTLVAQIRESYAGLIKKYSDDVEFARTMVMDGCFILEFCFKHEDEDLYLPNKMENSRIAMDLMLLENQVPFIVLQALFDCLAPYIVKGKGSVTLNQVLDNYLAPYIFLFHSLPPEKISTSDPTHDHVLGYLHKHYQLVAAKSSKPKHAEASMGADEEQAAESSDLILTEASKLAYSIVDLDRSGVNFKPHQEDNFSMTIKFQPPLFRCLPWFWNKPTLLMPTLVINDFTEVILRNFIAYEQSFPQGRYYFTSYVHAMDMLIDTQEDVAILAESKVLVNILGTNQEAADMLHKVDQNIPVTAFYYPKEFIQMYEYSDRFWPKIKRTYFSNPWNVINLLAGIIVFIATVGATIFAVLEYFR